MKRQRRRKASPQFCLDRATVPASLQARQAALWAIRLAGGEVRNDFLAQSPESFLEITAPHLKWCDGTFRSFLSYYEGDEEEIEALSKLPPDIAWEQMSSEGDYNVQQAFKSFRKFENPALKRVLKASKLSLEENLVGQSDRVLANVLMLQQMLSLSDTEVALLHLSAVASQNKATRSILQGTNIENASDGAIMLTYLLNVDEVAVHAALKQTAMLSILNFFKRPDVIGDLYEMLTLQNWCHACFSEPHDSVAELVRHFLEPANPGSLSASDFPHLTEDVAAISSYLKGAKQSKSRGVNLLIYGPPGTGKTEFAKALASHLNLALYEVANHFDNGDPIRKSERLAFLKISEKFLASHQNAIILFDEMEDVFPERFNPGRPSSPRRYAATGKAWMNQTLENNQVPVIWISNDIEEMDPAYLRRFSYHLEIRTPPLPIRQVIAQRYLGDTGISSEFIDQLAADSNLTPAVMENAARFVKLVGESNAEFAEKLAKRVIRNCQGALGQSSRTSVRTHATEYSLDYLNLDCRYGIDRVIGALERQPESSLCFYGLPGTGKTALAEHIASTLGRPLIARRASDLLSKWLGDGEKNLAAMFEEARSEHAVLLLDEADSFLRNRGQAERNWEVSQVNELLQQMERHDGIFICATNLFEHLDPAALRRFTFKIQFKVLSPEQRERLFVQEALRSKAEKMTTSLRARLHQLDTLAPGDFAVVQRQAALLGELLSPDEFLAELENECHLKPGASKQSIGFMH